ncbi:MAG: universal stress protein [Chitinispirillaceae bacterium]|nr:universal stress protein [Chitinispirillaceae bacterium]
MRPIIERIMVYVDGSEQSVTAVEYALCLARATGASLSALYVINTRALDELVKASIFLRSEQEEYSRDIEADAQRYCNLVKDMARGKGVPVDTLCAKGSVHQEITAMIKERSIDLLVIGELSRMHSRRDELYDDTERAMRLSSCSVLIVKDGDRVSGLFDEMV